MTIRTVIADDQDVVGAGFRMIPESQPDIEVVADVADVVEHRPDVFLLDVRGPGLDGLEATRRLSGDPATADTPHIVIVTAFDLDEHVHAALHGGASGFLLEDASPAVLVEAVPAAAVGNPLRPARHHGPPPAREGPAHPGLPGPPPHGAADRAGTRPPTPPEGGLARHRRPAARLARGRPAGLRLSHGRCESCSTGRPPPEP